MNKSCGDFEPLKTEAINAFVAAYILIMSLSIIGNCAVFIVIAANRHMRTVTNLLICNSAVADLLITLLPTTYELLNLTKYKGTWPMGSFMCSFLYLCNYCSVSASIFTLLVLAVDRYRAIMNPFKKFVTLKMIKLIIPIIWTVSLFFASPVIFTQKVISSQDQKVCVEIWPDFMPVESPKHYTVILFTCLYVVPLLIILILYGLMAIKLTSSVNMSVKIGCKQYRSCTIESTEEEIIQNCNNEEMSSTRIEKTELFLKRMLKFPKKFQRRNKACILPRNSILRKRRVIRMLVAVVMNFAICWLPVHLIQFLSYFHPYYSRCHQALQKAANFGYIMQYANSSINPMLYFLLSASYRNGFREALKMLMSGKKKDKLIRVRTRKITKSSFLGSNPNIGDIST